MLSYKLFHLLISIKTVMLDYCKFEIIMKNNSFVGILYFFCLKDIPQIGCDDHHSISKSNLC